MKTGHTPKEGSNSDTDPLAGAVVGSVCEQDPGLETAAISGLPATLTLEEYFRDRDEKGYFLLHRAAQDANVDAILAIKELPFRTDYYLNEQDNAVTVGLRTSPVSGVAVLTGQRFIDRHPDEAIEGDPHTVYARLQRASHEEDLFTICKCISAALRQTDNLSEFAPPDTLRKSHDKRSGDSLLTQAVKDQDPKLVAVLVSAQSAEDHDWHASHDQLEAAVQDGSKDEIDRAAKIHLMVCSRHSEFILPPYTNGAVEALYNVGGATGDLNRFSLEIKGNGTRGLRDDRKLAIDTIIRDQLNTFRQEQSSPT